MSGPIGSVDEGISPRPSLFSRVVGFLVTATLILFVTGLTGMFYYYGQTLEQQIRSLDEDRFVVESELKQCETARIFIERKRAELARLEARLKVARQRHPSKRG